MDKTQHVLDYYSNDRKPELYDTYKAYKYYLDKQVNNEIKPDFNRALIELLTGLKYEEGIRFQDYPDVRSPEIHKTSDTSESMDA